jgi:hypothetical protein
MADQPDDPRVDASEFLRREIHNMINRYNEITVYQVIGVLEVVKMDIWDRLERMHKREDGE